MVIAAAGGTAGEALRAARSTKRSFRDAVAVSPQAGAGGHRYLLAQAIEAASYWARIRAEPPTPGHLLVALIDQRSLDVEDVLKASVVEAQVVRRSVLDSVGAFSDMPPIPIPIPMPDLPAAGTGGRPALPSSMLDTLAPAELAMRLERLPVHRVRRPPEAGAVMSHERRAVSRIADRLRLDDDQHYSLEAHHSEAVRQRLEGAIPASGLVNSHRFGTGATQAERAIRFRRSHPHLVFMVGWATWFRNRRVGARQKWFVLTTLRRN